MIKTTMAEAVRESPRRTKTKAKKRDRRKDCAVPLDIVNKSAALVAEAEDPSCETNEEDLPSCLEDGLVLRDEATRTISTDLLNMNVVPTETVVPAVTVEGTAVLPDTVEATAPAISPEVADTRPLFEPLPIQSMWFGSGLDVETVARPVRGFEQKTELTVTGISEGVDEQSELTGIFEQMREQAELTGISEQVDEQAELTGIFEQVELPGICEQADEQAVMREPVQAPTVMHHPLYPEIPKAEQVTAETRFRPMSVDELQKIYYNAELMANSHFVDSFVTNEEKRQGHEFYEILSNYVVVRKKLLGVEEDLKQLNISYEELLGNLWIVQSNSVAVEGRCADGSKVQKVHVFDQCRLNSEAVASLSSKLRSIQNLMEQDLALFAYSSQLSKLQVESYLHQLFTSCPHLRDMPKDALVTATDHTSDVLHPQVEKLRQCISVIFSFHRKPSKDEELRENLRKWTGRLVGALLRVASYADHLFILNHVLRSPAGVGQWAKSFVQIPAPASLALQTTLGSPVLDHAVTCLATILLPIRAREEFMCHMRISMTDQGQHSDQTWTLIDSDGEEDEDPAEAWVYLLENDVVSLLQQVPMQAVFAHILQAPVDESGIVHYDVRRCTEPSMLKLFAFSSVWVSLFGAGLKNYNMVRYRQLNKRLARNIRQIISFVSDHWLNFKTYYGPLASAASIDRLQVEFDQLFIRATYTILTAEKLGSWQFMADMPFTCLSAGSVWKLLWLLQQGQRQAIDLYSLPPVTKCKEDMKDIHSRHQLADALQILPRAESIYLLTTFANMAASRPLEEDDFIECITLQLFEISYICDHTRQLCSKTGRELLSSIIQKHPTALSMLLRRVQEVMSELGTMALYLFDELPAAIWIPQDPDMLLLRQWLLNNDLTTPENQLACVVLNRMNWDLFTETGKLVLNIRLHRQVALLLVEAYVKFISERRASFFIIEGMKQMASYAYMSSQGSREQQFSNWAWSLALRLKLHRQAAILHSYAAESHPFSAPVLEQEPWLLPLLTGARAKNPLACFLVLAMTDIGHDKDTFIRVGLDYLHTLVLSNQFSATIHILSCVTPQFLSSPQYLLENEVFLKVLQVLLVADDSVLRVTKMAMGLEFKAGAVTQQFTQMIQAMISARLDCHEALPMLLFWVQAIFKVSNFLTDQNCCYVLDHLVRWGYLQKGAREKLDALFTHYHKQQLTENKSRGGLFGLMGGRSAGPPSLMERSSMPEFGWLATQILTVEDRLDQESRLWPLLQQELLMKQTSSLESSLKNVMSVLKPDHPPSVGRLCIYRWAQQALDMSISHPMMPLVWQRFFSLFLGRCGQQSSIPTRASVGERFFQSMTMSSMLKKMKKRLAEAADFHLKYDPQADAKVKDKDSQPPQPSPSRAGSETDTPLPSPQTEENPQYFSSKEFHNQLAKLYQTLCLWLDEPRLHGAELYLPALPPPYEAARLMQVFTPGNSPWLEFVDFDGAQYEISVFSAEWRAMVSGQPQFGSSSLFKRHKSILSGQRTATERILERLQRFSSPVAPPALQPVVAPVPDISSALLTDKRTAIHLLDSDLSTLTDFTKFVFTRAAQQCAINGTFLELLPSQYSNVAKQASVVVECRSRVNPLHRCSGPAAISVRVEERTLNQVVQRKMDENRAEYKQLVIESVLPPPQNICIAAVHVENTITALIKLSQGTADPDKRATLDDVACTLFFHLTVQVCEEINFYPPTRQFFTSCVEILGQEFLSRSPNQTPLLLQFSLDNPNLAGMVAPHFKPNNNPANFVSMYEQLITALQQQNLSLVFMLLTKFDVKAWLEHHEPSAGDKSRFLGVLGSTLMSCGAEPSADTKLVFDLYVGHLRSILRHEFPSNLTSVLSLLLEGSSSEELHTSCWEILLAECCAAATANPSTAAPVFSIEQVQNCQSLPLSTQQLQELLQWLGSYFMHERRTQRELSDFGLYPRWGRYVPYISLLMGMLARSFIAKVIVGMQDQNPYQALQMLWQQQLELWQAWLEPLPSIVPSPVPAQIAVMTELMQPWTQADATVALSMVEGFKSTVLYIYTMLNDKVPQYSCTVFSLLLMHYLVKFSHRLTPTHVSDVFVAEFSQLPWERLKPDLQLLETMAQMKEHCATQCFELIGHVMTRVPWGEVMATFQAQADRQVTQRVQGALLLLLIQCHGDSAVREMPEIPQLLVLAEMFDWSGLTVDAYRTASFWFLQMCEPQWILAQRSSLPALGLRLMKCAAEFSPSCGAHWTEEVSVKRLSYLHCVTQQLCQVTYLPNTDIKDASTVLINTLSEIEAVESAVPDIRSQEEESLDLMKEVLSLLNNSNPDGAWQTELLSTLCQWLHSSPHSLLLTPCIKAASRCLASLSQMVLIVETCIQVYFTACSKDKDGASAHTSTVGVWEHILAVVQIPELNVELYVEEALQSGAYLLLYALVLHRRPLCTALDDEAKLMEELLKWAAQATPTADNEAKLLLWWLVLCQMWLHQVDCGAPMAVCVNVAQRLVALLHQLGEDRATTGFFGVLGLGKRSQLSLEFRLAVRSIAAFLSSQILSETTIRFQPVSPLSDIVMAKQCRATLTSMRSNKAYVGLKTKVDSMIGFIHRTDHTARNVLDLIEEVALTLYPSCDYLSASL